MLVSIIERPDTKRLVVGFGEDEGLQRIVRPVHHILEGRPFLLEVVGEEVDVAAVTLFRLDRDVALVGEVEALGLAADGSEGFAGSPGKVEEVLRQVRRLGEHGAVGLGGCHVRDVREVAGVDGLDGCHLVVI